MTSNKSLPQSLARWYFTTFILLTLVFSLSTPAALAKTEGVFIGKNYNVIRVKIKGNLAATLKPYKLKARLYNQIISSAKARNGGKIPSTSNQYFVAVVKNSQLWAAEFGPVGSIRRIHSANIKNQRAFFTWTGKALTSVQTMDRWPIRFSKISSNFNPRRRHPITKRIRPHKGIDLIAPYGTAIRAPAAGRVTHRAGLGGYGRTVKINHGKGYVTLYAHLKGYARSAKKGSYVKKGQIIGYVGNSGSSTNTHLHYEIQVNGVARNPRTVKLLNSRFKLSGKSLAIFEKDRVNQRTALKSARAPLGIR